MTQQKQLLIVSHTPSTNTRALSDQILTGSRAAIHALETEPSPIAVRLQTPFNTTAEDVLHCDAIILGTPENLGYMSGALKDFFDRIYYPCLEKTQGLPYAAYIRARHDGTGTQRAINTIVTGLKWRSVQDTLILKGDFQPEFLTQCHELGLYMASALEAGVI